MLLRQITDAKLAQNAYLIGCQQTGEALVIDPERDIDRYAAIARQENLRITAVAETHIHADFLSGARESAEQFGTRVYLSAEGGPDWSYAWADGRDDVQLLRGGDTFTIGHVEIKAVHTPGHTPEHLSFLVTDRGGGADAPMGLVSGDFVFAGDTGRPDLLETAAPRGYDPQGASGQAGAMRPSAERLYGSVQRFLELDDYLQVWPGHGAGSACGKALGSVPKTTVGYERRFSPALGAAREGEAAFVDYVLADQPEPPVYFARMKEQNKQGPPLLNGLPQPPRLSVEELRRVAGEDGTVALDLRSDRAAFMQRHLPGALFAPLNKSFPTIAGSYVRPEHRIVLIAEAEQVDEAVRCLVRVGLDTVAGFAPPATLEALAAQGADLASTKVIDFDALEDRRGDAGAHVLDVRSGSEYRAGHVPGAQHLPHTRLAAHLDEVPREKTLLVHCGSGARAAAAVSFLERAGFEAAHVNGLFRDYASQGSLRSRG